MLGMKCCILTLKYTLTNTLQFYRAFPGPPDLDEAEITRLIKKYQDPTEAGLIVYLNLHHDLVAVRDNLAAEQLNLNDTAPKSDYIPGNVCNY